ncbi:MAG: transcription-repair coupling factor, partial [Oscillospiraceae bacterium]
MEALLRELWQLREIQELAQLMESGGGPALVTGLSPVHRAMTAAALRLKSGRPLLMLCADEGEARRQAADLRSLTGREPVLLTGRELHWRELAAVSRQWEYRRLEALYRIRQEESPVIVTTADALALRCIPPQVLERCSFTLRSDGRYQVEELARRLTAAGYTCTEQVEGPGQFALRGGILDVYSPGAEAPVRCEFFDDEVDSLGFFDVATQRRTENCREALLLPAGEVLPLWRDGAAEETAERLETLAGRMKDKPVARQLRSDADLLRQGIVPNGSDRFLAAVYPEMVTAMDYLPKECLVCVSESGRTAEALKGWLSQMKADVTSAMESGILCGPMAEAALPETDFARQLERFPVCQLESLPTSRYLLAPKALLQIDARQLSGYGGSLETAVTDLTHYLTSGCRVMVLCGGQVRARNLQELLEARRIPAALDLEGERSPVRNVVLITLGTLSAGCEYPALQLAVLTEGQLT